MQNQKSDIPTEDMKSIQARIQFHRHYMGIAKAMSLLSKAQVKIGAIIVKDKMVVGGGVNGFPRGYDDRGLDERTPEKYGKVIHAEMNVLLRAKQDVDTIYIYGLPPCPECMKSLVVYGVKYVYYTIDNDLPTPTLDKWVGAHNNLVHLHKDHTHFEEIL